MEVTMNHGEQVRNFLAESFLFSSDGFTLRDDDSLMENGVIDSTGILELIQFVEDLLGIEVPDEDITPDNFDTVERIVAYLEQNRPQAASCA
jgi:acyl carrier protein